MFPLDKFHKYKKISALNLKTNAVGNSIDIRYLCSIQIKLIRHEV